MYDSAGKLKKIQDVVLSQVQPQRVAAEALPQRHGLCVFAYLLCNMPYMQHMCKLMKHSCNVKSARVKTNRDKIMSLRLDACGKCRVMLGVGTGWFGCSLGSFSM